HPGSAQPVAREARPGPAPTQVSVYGDLGPAEALVAALAGAEIAVQRTMIGPGFIVVPGATLALTDGRSATRRAAEEGIADLVLFDLALDFAKSSRIVIAAADQLFQGLGKAVSVIDDSPGLIILRTVCMLANAAAEAVGQGVCSAADCDIAMQGGVNYPLGPLAWADAIGLARVATALDHLYGCYGDERYRPAALLRRKLYGGRRFHE
ncbi:MAG: 3-hydroxyacyl-CoA dehydrogenase family protein, partial [Nitrococcus sp.]|nr:3-hydroxyacyl-CoA dehydrogenase family protein [Nitrococcus sp.]